MYRRFNILIVEDDPADADLIRETLEEAKIMVELNVVEDGMEALAYLRREGRWAGVERPDLILLDLNLPRKDGRELIRDMKGDPALRRIPVVVLTTSAADEDILRCYDLGVNCYVAKPMGIDAFARIIQAVEDFWFSVVKLPPRTH